MPIGSFEVNKRIEHLEKENQEIKTGNKMKAKIQLTMILCFCWFVGFSQIIDTNTAYQKAVEFTGGFNINSYYNLDIWEDYYSTYDTRPGYNIALGYESNKALKLKFSLGLEKYNGGLKVSEYGINTGRSTFAEIEKTVISLNMFLYNFSIFDKIDVNMGLNINRMLSEKFKGTHSSWYGINSADSDLNEIYNHYSSIINYGLLLRIAYNFKLSESAYLTAQYYYHLGLSNEFVEFPKSIFSHRNYFCLGLKYMLSNSKSDIK